MKHQDDNGAAGGADLLLGGILAGVDGEDEQLRVLVYGFRKRIELPADAFVVGEPVSVLSLEYRGSTRRGLTATCRGEHGGDHEVALADVCFPGGSAGERCVAAYRRWIGLEVSAIGFSKHPWAVRRHKARPGDLDLRRSLEIVALSVAASVFERMLWMNPSDNQGVRFLLPALRAGQHWEDHHEDD